MHIELHPWRPMPTEAVHMPFWSDRRRCPPLLLIFIVAGAYGLMLSLSLRNPANSVKGDSIGYLQLAHNLKTLRRFSREPSPPHAPELLRLPGYPFFLAALQTTSPAAVERAIAAQCLLGFSLLFVVWPLFYRYGGWRGGVAGSVFLCLDPVLLLHQGLILTEPVFMFVFALAFVYSLRHLENAKISGSVLTGTAYGVAALIKPVALCGLAPFWLVSFKKWRRTLLLMLLALAWPLGWVARNWVQSGHPVYTIQGGLALLQYPAASALAMDTGRTRLEALTELENTLRRDGLMEAEDPVIQNRIYQEYARHIMKEHRGAVLRYSLMGALRILGGTGLEMILELLPAWKTSPRQDGTETAITLTGIRSLLRSAPGLAPLQLAYWLFLLGGYLLFLFGLRRFCQSQQWALAAYLVLAVSLLLAISAHQGYYRFRIPMLPFLALGIARALKPAQKLAAR